MCCTPFRQVRDCSALQVEHLVPADSNGLALSRSPAEILALVFLGSPDIPGGFFPNGLNGAVGSKLLNLAGGELSASLLTAFSGARFQQL